MQFVEHLNVNCALLRAPAGDAGHAHTIVRAETVPFELDAGAAVAAAATPAHADAEERHVVFEREQQVRVKYVVTRDATADEIMRARAADPWVRVKYVVTRDATADEITRARAADPWVRVRESPEQYAAETVPKLPARKLAAAWVREIIDGSKPDEDVLVREADWVLVRDNKKCHDPHKPEDAYYIALFEDASLGSLRDLRAEHLPLLRRVLGEAPGAVHARLAAADPEAPLPQLVCFVQYEPQYWYLHVHVVAAQHKMFTEWTGGNLALMALDRWHTLEDVIERLELRGDYYARAEIPCLVKRTGTAEPPQADKTSRGGT